MKVIVASLTLRFHEQDGWTIKKLREYLVNPETKITYRLMNNVFGKKDNYYAVYENSGFAKFKKTLIEENEIINPHNYKINWYIK